MKRADGLAVYSEILIEFFRSLDGSVEEDLEEAVILLCFVSWLFVD